MAFIRRNDDGSATAFWREGGRGSRQRQQTFQPPRVKGAASAYRQAQEFADAIERQKKLHGVVRIDRGSMTIEQLAAKWIEDHVAMDCSRHTLENYLQQWGKHLRPRVGSMVVREFTAQHGIDLRKDLEKAGVGNATVRKCMAVLQSMFSHAKRIDQLSVNPLADVKKPPQRRDREPYIFLPAEVESIRRSLDSVRDRTLVSVLAYAGPRPEEALRLRLRDVGERSLHFVDTKRDDERWPPLLEPLALDLREYLLTLGKRMPNSPLFAAHDGGHWQPDDWRNWRKRVWKLVAPEGTRPRDLRSSFITVQIYAGAPLALIAKWTGTSVSMIEKHYQGVLAEWDGTQVPAEDQIRKARGQRPDGGAQVVAL